MKKNQEEGLPKYIQVKNRIRSLIKEKKLKPGEKIPSENQMLSELDVSRNTIRQAITELVNDGILSKEQGRGTFYTGENKGAKTSTRLVGVINHSIMDSIYPDIIRGIEDTLHEKGYSLLLTNCNHDPEKELAALNRMISQGIDGLIIEPCRSGSLSPQDTLFKKLIQQNMPIITTNCRIPLLNASSVTVDDYNAGYKAATYFIQHGHKKCAVIYKKDVNAGQLRAKGFRQAFLDSNLDFPDNHLCSFVEEDEKKIPGYYFSKKLLKLAAPPTGIFYYNDQIALQGMNYFNEEMIPVPEKISLIGFDNLPETQYLSPPLTTFEHPKYNLGEWAARILLEELSGSVIYNSRNMTIDPQLIERGSVRSCQ